MLYKVLSQYLFLRHCMVLTHFFCPFLEKYIYRCNLPCRHGGHFHCPFCGETVVRKDTMKKHLIECKHGCDFPQLTTVPPPQPAPTETHPALSSVDMEHSYVSAVKTDHSYVQTASPKTPAVVTELKKDQEAEPKEPDLFLLSPTAITSKETIAPENKTTGKLPPAHVQCPH